MTPRRPRTFHAKSGEVAPESGVVATKSQRRTEYVRSSNEASDGMLPPRCAAARSCIRYIPDPSLKRQTPRATSSPNLDLGILPSPFAQPFECPSLLVVSHRVPRSRQNRLEVESPLIEDVFVCCTSFLRMYFHRVSSRHWPSPLTHQSDYGAHPRRASFGSLPFASLSATSLA